MAKKRKKKDIKKQERLQSQKVAEVTPKILFYILLAGLCLLVFYPPYFRALFFTKELLPAHFFSLLLFGLWWVVKYKKDSKFISSPLDYCVLGFMAAYAVSFFVAVNYRAALEEFLKVGNYFIVFYLASRLVENKGHLRSILKVLSLSALGVALLGIGSAAGTWEVNGAYVGGRIHSTIQYPNSLGAYLTAAYLLLQTLFLTEENEGYKKYLKYFYPAAAYVLLVTIVFTQSRGTWVIIPPVLFLSLLLSPGKGRLRALSFQLVTAIPVLVVVPGMGNAFQADGSTAWLWLAAGAALSVSGYLLVQGLSFLPKQAKLVLSVLMVMGFLGVGTYSINNVLNKTLSFSTPVDAQPVTKSMTSQISDIIPGEDYNLHFKIKAEEAEEEQPYAWMIDIISINEEGTAERVVRESGGKTADWEEKVLSFQVPEDADSLRLVLYNRFPGTSAEFDRLMLVGPEGKEHPVSFNLYKILPAALARRVATFQSGTEIASSRVVFFKDALNIIRDYPVLGLGGGGWKSIYLRYQSEEYFTSEVHNHFLQVWIETGTIGLLIFLGIWLTFLYTCYRIYFKQSNENNRLLISGICLAALTLGIHSFYDFNLSLGAVGIFLWAVFGLARGLERLAFSESEDKVEEKITVKKYTSTAGMSITLIFFFIVSSLYIGSSAALAAQQYLMDNRVEKVVASLEKSVKWDPLAVNSRLQLGEIYHAIGNQEGNMEYLEKASYQYNRALKMDKYNPQVTRQCGILAFNMGEFEEGLFYLRETIDNDPYYEDSYLNLSQAYYSAAEYYLREDNKEKTKEYLEQVIEVEKSMLEYHEHSTILNLSLGEAHFLLGNHQDALNYLEQVKGEDDLGETYLFLALTNEKLGNIEEMEIYLEKVEEIDDSLLDLIDDLRSWSF